MCDFFEACRNGDVATVQTMISAHVLDELNIALAYACGSDHLRVVELLIVCGANDWNLGLSNACCTGHLNIVNLMISKGANNWKDGLIYACSGGHVQLVRLMIQKGANNWNEALEFACSNGHVEVVDLMIKNGATTLNDALIMADSAEHLQIVEMLLSRGATHYLRFARGDPAKLHALIHDHGLALAILQKISDIKYQQVLLLLERQNRILTSLFIADLGILVNEYLVRMA